MPINLSCPSCETSVPVTDTAGVAIVECHSCGREFDTPAEVFAGPARDFTPNSSAAGKSGKRRRNLDHDDDDDRKDRRKPKNESGGSPVMMIVASVLGLLFVASALGFTSWLILTTDTEKTTTANARKSSNSGIPTTSPNSPRINPPTNPFPPVEPPDITPPRTNPPKTNPPKTNPPKTDPPVDTSPKTNPPKTKPPVDIPPPMNPPPMNPPKADGFEFKVDSGTPVKIEPAELETAVFTVRLPGKVETVLVGGGGRYLVMHFAADRRVAVFDISTTKIVREMEVPEGALIAAGLNKMVVQSTKKRTLNVYTLPDLKPDVGGTPPNDGQAIAITMGSATNGPLLYATLGEISLYDLKTMAVVPGSARFGGGSVPIHGGVQLRAAPKGNYFTTVFPLGASSTGGTLRVKDGKWVDARLAQVGNPIPLADGETIFGTGVIYGIDGRQLSPKVSGLGKGVWYVPAVHGTQFVKLSEKRVGTGFPAKQSLLLTIHDDNDPKTELASFGELPETDGLVDWVSGAPQPLDRFVFLVPDANVIALIPPTTRDRIVLRKLDRKKP